MCSHIHTHPTLFFYCSQLICGPSGGSEDAVGDRPQRDPGQNAWIWEPLHLDGGGGDVPPSLSVSKAPFRMEVEVNVGAFTASPALDTCLTLHSDKSFLTTLSVLAREPSLTGLSY